MKIIIEFKDSQGWYCPGEPWANPTPELIAQWSKEKRSDVRVRLVFNK